MGNFNFEINQFQRFFIFDNFICLEAAIIIYLNKILFDNSYGYRQQLHRRT